MISANHPWTPKIDWKSPAGFLLDEIVAALPCEKQWNITVFGSAPLQLGIDAGFISSDVDVISLDDINQHLHSAGLLKGQRDFYVEPCPPHTFVASTSWRDRAHTEARGSVLFSFPHPIDILVSKIGRLEEKDLNAFLLVQSKTNILTEEFLKSSLKEVVDIYRPRFDEEKNGDPLSNTRILWKRIFGHDIDVRKEIISPAIQERQVSYGRLTPNWLGEISNITPSVDLPQTPHISLIPSTPKLLPNTPFKD